MLSSDGHLISTLSISRKNCQLLDVRIGDEDNAKAKESTGNRKTGRVRCYKKLKYNHL